MERLSYPNRYNLKEECKNLPQLRLPKPEDNPIMQTDASGKVCSAVLKTDLIKFVDARVEHFLKLKKTIIPWKKKFWQ